MKEIKPLQYGESGAIDYLPGAEVLKTTDEIGEQGILLFYFIFYILFIYASFLYLLYTLPFDVAEE